MRNDDSPIWSPIAFFVIFAAMMFTVPNSISDDNAVFVLNNDVWKWLLIYFCCLLGLALMSENFHEYKSFEPDERIAFFKVILLWMLVLCLATFGAGIMSSYFRANVTGFYILSLIFYCSFGIFRLVRKRYF